VSKEIAMAVAVAPLVRYRLSAADYHQMIEAGILDERTRVELIEGEMVVMSPIGAKHSGLVNQLATIFYEQLRGRALLSVQNAVRLDDYTEPQPDLALLKPRSDYYKRSLPTPGDIHLLVEVADSSLEYDQDVKMSLYARAGVREVWIVNLVDIWVEVYRDPSPVGYTTLLRMLPGRTFAPEALPDLMISVDELFTV
jgi:Uma2 family endonuclease